MVIALRYSCMLKTAQIFYVLKQISFIYFNFAVESICKSGIGGSRKVINSIPYRWKFWQEEYLADC